MKPKPGTVVNALIQSIITGEKTEILLRSVDEPDCDWRVYEADGHEDELNELNWNVISWTD